MGSLFRAERQKYNVALTAEQIKSGVQSGHPVNVMASLDTGRLWHQHQHIGRTSHGRHCNIGQKWRVWGGVWITLTGDHGIILNVYQREDTGSPEQEFPRVALLRFCWGGGAPCICAIAHHWIQACFLRRQVACGDKMAF